MPYMMMEEDGKYSVYKQGDDKKPTGKARNKKPMTKAQAEKYMSALYANENKSLTDEEMVDLEEKCYSDDYYHRKIWQDDSRVAYDPMGGRTGDKACANCFWFNPGSASCEVVSGQIVATGLSNMWLSKEAPANTVVNPLPVYIVDEPDVVETAQMSLADKGAAAKPTLVNRIMSVFSKAVPEAQTESSFKVYPDGRWIGWWTNNAKDRVNENFSAKSIDAYIDRVDSAIVPYPELWYKHLPMRMGKSDFLARIGYMTFATGTFYDTPVGQKAKAFYEAEQKAGRPKTMSHGFLYPTNLKANGVYHAFNTFEISVLDPGEEANPYTNFEVKAMFAELSQKKRDDLEKIFGKEEAAKLLNFGEQKSKELEATPGVDLKSFQSFEGVELQDKTAQAAIQTFAEVTTEGFKAISARLDGLETKVTAIETKASGAESAVAELKTFIQTELGYTPRASKAAATQIAATDPQVVHLQQKSAEAGEVKTEAMPEGVSEFGKGIFAEIAKVMKAQPTQS